MIKNRINSLGLLVLTMNIINADDNIDKIGVPPHGGLPVKGLNNVELSKDVIRKIQANDPELLEYLEVYYPYQRSRKQSNSNNSSSKATKTDDRTSIFQSYEAEVFSDDGNTIHIGTVDEELYNNDHVVLSPSSTLDVEDTAIKATSTDQFIRCDTLHNLKKSNGKLLRDGKTISCHGSFPINTLQYLIKEATEGSKPKVEAPAINPAVICAPITEKTNGVARADVECVSVEKAQ